MWNGNSLQFGTDRSENRSECEAIDAGPAAGERPGRSLPRQQTPRRTRSKRPDLATACGSAGSTGTGCHAASVPQIGPRRSWIAVREEL